MRIVYLLLPIFIMIASCSPDDVDYVTINGKVQRTINGDGIPDQSVTVMTRKSTGSGWLGTIRELDRKEVKTDEHGNFSVSLKQETDAFVTAIYLGDDNYFGTGIYSDYPIDEPVIIAADKFIKFKILVNNTNPFDENDFIKIDFYSGLANVVMTGIENFGVDNTYHPPEPLPGGGAHGGYEETSWTGMDVNSIVYYSIPETAEHFKIRWYMTKNGIDSEGFTDEIPHDINEVNLYSFEY